MIWRDRGKVMRLSWGQRVSPKITALFPDGSDPKTKAHSQRLGDWSRSCGQGPRVKLHPGVWKVSLDWATLEGSICLSTSEKFSILPVFFMMQMASESIPWFAFLIGKFPGDSHSYCLGFPYRRMRPRESLLFSQVNFSRIHVFVLPIVGWCQPVHHSF